MSNFTPKVKFTTEFDGDTISMELARLKRKHVVLIAPYMEGVDEDGNVVVSVENKVEFTEVMMGILPEVVSNFVGLVDSENAPLTIEEAIEETYFSDLVGSIMSELFRISRPTEEQLAEVKKPQLEVSEGSDEEVGA